MSEFDKDHNDEMKNEELERRQKIIDFIIKEYKNDAEEFCILVKRRGSKRLEWHYSELTGNIIGFLSYSIEMIKYSTIINGVVSYIKQKLGE